MGRKTGRYSGYIRPILYVIDLAIVLSMAAVFLSLEDYFLYFAFLIPLGWVVAAVKTGFYEVYRFTQLTRIFSLIGVQLLLFTLSVFAFFGLFMEAESSPATIAHYILYTFGVITIVKLSVFYFLKKYRTVLGGNYRSVVILGENAKTKQLEAFFLKNPDYGYQLRNVFGVDQQGFSIEQVFGYIVDNSIDEIYCSIAEFNNEQIREITDFADNNLKILKFIPDNKEIFTKKLNYQYLGLTPVLALREIPIDTPINQFIKRTFDIVMSVLVLVGLLSWLTPLLAILIKLESKGPVFFKQRRNGLDYQEFYCYKFRSMRPNPTAHLHQVRRGDERITRVGRILRKTSLDELPQFINVLKGEMSVVGPRPHMVSHTHMYAERIDKFMVRHFIKPGITGLAQTSGYRGEVETDHDIINRVKFDIFYVENWSLLLDIKIVIQTVIKALSGDEKAY